MFRNRLGPHTLPQASATSCVAALKASVSWGLAYSLPATRSFRQDMDGQSYIQYMASKLESFSSGHVPLNLSFEFARSGVFPTCRVSGPFGDGDACTDWPPPSPGDFCTVVAVGCGLWKVPWVKLGAGEGGCCSFWAFKASKRALAAWAGRVVHVFHVFQLMGSEVEKWYPKVRLGTPTIPSNVSSWWAWRCSWRNEDPRSKVLHDHAREGNLWSAIVGQTKGHLTI